MERNPHFWDHRNLRRRESADDHSRSRPQAPRRRRARAALHRGAHAQRFCRQAGSGRTAAPRRRPRQDGPDQRQSVAAAHRLRALEGRPSSGSRPRCSPGNLDKTLAAPVVAIAGYDVKFYEHLPFLFPHADAKRWFSGNAEFAARSAFQNGTLQVAYLILALRAVGLDTGPMTGFDNAKVDAEFFAGTDVKSNVLINIGYGDSAKLFPRSPRFSFDQIAKIV